MALGRPKAVLVLSAQQREQLERLASSRSLPAGLVARARMILMSAAGIDNQEIARQLRITQAGGQVAAAIFGTRCGGTAR
jgi:putative transposase